MSLFKNIRNESGYTLAIALLLIVLISALSFSLITVSSNTLGITKGEREDQSLFYIAESGANIKKKKAEGLVYDAYIATREEHRRLSELHQANIDFIELYKHNIKSLLPTVNKTYNDFEKQLSKQPEACVNVTTVDNGNEFKLIIESTGYLVDNESVINCLNDQFPNNYRVVEKDITVNLDLQFLEPDESGGSEDGDNEIIVPDLEELAVWTNGDILLQESSKILGSIGSTNGSLTMKGSSSITGNIGVNEDKVTLEPGISIDGQLVDTRPPEQFPEPKPIPAFPSDKMINLEKNGPPSQFPMTGNDYTMPSSTSNATLQLHEDARLNNLTVSGGQELTIDIGDKNVHLLVDGNFNFNGRNLTITGSGTLSIYTRGNFHLTSDSTLRSEGTLNIFTEQKLSLADSSIVSVDKKLTLYSKGELLLGGEITNPTQDPSLGNIYYTGVLAPKLDGGSQTIYASLFIEKADLTLSGSKQILGNIVSLGNQVTITGGGPPSGHYIFVPNGKVDVHNDYTGMIIASTFTGRGNSTITYGTGALPPPFIPEIPNYDYSDPTLDSLFDDIITKEIDK